MEKSELRFFLSFETFPIFVHLIQEDGSSNHVGHYEGNGTVNGAVHMGFSREMDDTVGLEVPDNRFHQTGVRDIALDELISGIPCDGHQVIQIAGIGKFVQVEDVVVGLSDLLQDEVAADKACSSGDDYFFQCSAPVSLFIGYLIHWRENSSKSMVKKSKVLPKGTANYANFANFYGLGGAWIRLPLLSAARWQGDQSNN